MAQFFGGDRLQRKHKIYTRPAKVNGKYIGFYAEVFRNSNFSTDDITKSIPELEKPLEGSETDCWLAATRIVAKAYESGIIE